MSDVLSFNPSRALDANAVNSPGALAYFYDAGTTTLRTVYADSDLTIPHPSPLVADAAGVFAAVYAGGSAVKVVVQTSAGATLYTLDPCLKVASSGAAASSVSFAPTVEIPVTDVQAAIEQVQTNIVAPLADFGLGVTGSVALLVSIDATNIASGSYRFDATTTGTYPTGVVAADTGAIQLVRETAGSAWMALYHDTTNAVFIRRMNASSWGAWRETGLGFTPIQQGGGTDMGTGKVYIGWRTDGAGLQAQVGATNIGRIVRNTAVAVSDDNTQLFAPGLAPLYACRAWVNFNGTGTVAIRGSGNVSSITDIGTGAYTVNFTTAMPDTAYSVVATGGGSSATIINLSATPTLTVSSVEVRSFNSTTAAANDPTHVMIAIFR